MILDLAELVVSCLDRDSITRLVRVTIPKNVLKEHLELKRKAERPDSTGNDLSAYTFDLLALKLFEALKQKGRAALRRPAKEQPSSTNT
jgi:hypothetical protein